MTWAEKRKETYHKPRLRSFLVVDFYPLYPPSIRPVFLDQIRNFYIDTYQDKFFTEPPVWFRAYMVMEAVYHLPLSVWAVGALLRG